eukprot:1526311-Prymnesium_polylepis.2
MTPSCVHTVRRQHFETRPAHRPRQGYCRHRRITGTGSRPKRLHAYTACIVPWRLFSCKPRDAPHSAHVAGTRDDSLNNCETELALLDFLHARQLCTYRRAPVFAAVNTELQLVRSQLALDRSRSRPQRLHAHFRRSCDEHRLCWRGDLRRAYCCARLAPP